MASLDEPYNRSIATEARIINQRTPGFTISRWIYGGMH